MTKINWLQEVEARKEALFADLFRLLKVPSVREDDKAMIEIGRASCRERV